MVDRKKRDVNDLRVCSFNINGLNTLFNYHPWNGMKSLDLAFEFLQCDIITLQELKLSKVSANLILKNYKSFVTIPRFKKGYSGVGVYVRQEHENEFLQKLLTVKKVEEGITGNLTLPMNKLVKYRDASDTYLNEVIGGYPETYNFPELDDEGRCICIELNFNVVIISLYCPANSLGTDDVEIFRMNFLHAVVERCQKLISMGKEVIVMGDINVSRDLIDSDEYIKEAIKLGVVKKIVDVKEGISQDEQGRQFEQLNKSQVADFRQLTEAKKLINSVVFDKYMQDFTPESPTTTTAPMFIDTLRMTQGRRLKMYTCWNTLKNYRPINSGSRIDHILATPKLSVDCYANIWNELMGSDHCPIYCDFNLKHYISNFQGAVDRARFLKFEASNYYGVDNGGNSIDKFFGRHRAAPIKRSLSTTTTTTTTTTTSPDTEADPPKSKPVYISRKKARKTTEANSTGQLGIANFFFKPITAQEHQEQDELSHSTSQSSQLSMEAFTNLLSSGKAGSSSPNCSHGEPATLRTSMKPLTKGKKFWCCARSLTSETFNLTGEDAEDRCNFFKWASK